MLCIPDDAERPPGDLVQVRNGWMHRVTFLPLILIIHIINHSESINYTSIILKS